jgi:hypothetical protein
MSEANQVNPINEVAPLQELVSPKILDALFTRLNPGDIEQFYQSYQSWILQQQRVDLLMQIATLQHKVMQHAEQMQGLAPSALALASLTQLQAYGVEDIDLLERMLERGEVWLDHTIQLLIRCKQLDVIGSNYTEWCEHALEGAYDWIDSIGEDTDETSVTLVGVEQGSVDATADISAQITEELILQKLMSDDEEADEIERVLAVDVSRITQPLSTPDILSSDDEYTETQNSTQELEDVPIAELQLNTEAVCEIHEIVEIDEEKQGEPVGMAIGPTDTKTNLIEELVLIQPSEVLPDPLINDQLASSSLDAESAEISPGTQANQLSTALSLDAQPTESVLANGQQAEEAEYAIDPAEEQQAEVPMSTEIEQMNLAEPAVQEQAEEVGEAIDISEEQQAEVPMSTEGEQVSLVEPAQQELGEEADFEAGDAIDLTEEQQIDVSISTEREQVSLVEPVQQITEHELAKEPELPPVHDITVSTDDTANSAEQTVVLEDSNASTQEEEKPRQEALSSERGFLRRLLARIWHR